MQSYLSASLIQKLCSFANALTSPTIFVILRFLGIVDRSIPHLCEGPSTCTHQAASSPKCNDGPLLWHSPERQRRHQIVGRTKEITF